jgi:nucleotide-binding universal stress UspA family protein
MDEQENAPRPQVVVGADGSTGAAHAMRWAAGLAGSLDADVVVVHAIGLLEERHGPGVSTAERRAELEALAESWCRPFAASGCRHRLELADGHPVDVLLRAAERSGASLVVVGCRGVGDNPALALGSTSLKLLQAADRPVLVVPAPRRPVPPGAATLGTILVGVDRSRPALAALERATDLAAAFGASLTAVEVRESAPTFPLGPSAAVTSAGEEAAVERDQAFLEDRARAIRARGVAVDVMVRDGDPAAELLAAAGELGVDLVAVGTRGRGGPADLLLGSVARTVAGRSVRPTLVVPAPAGEPEPR